MSLLSLPSFLPRQIDMELCLSKEPKISRATLVSSVVLMWDMVTKQPLLRTYNSGTGFPFLLLFLSPPPPPSAAPHHGHANIPDSVRYMPPSKPVGQHRNDVIWATLATTTRHVAAFEVDNRRMRPSESDDLIRCAHVSRSREEQAAAPRKQ